MLSPQTYTRLAEAFVRQGWVWQARLIAQAVQALLGEFRTPSPWTWCFAKGADVLVMSRSARRVSPQMSGSG